MNKEIMEIIEPYMDKTLSDWCYVQIDFFGKWIFKLIENNEKWLLINTYIRYNKWYFSMIEEWKWGTDWFDKIIWHYDITAVLKYLNDYCMYFTFDIINDDILIWDKRNEATIIWDIPNKPLHLYTTEEQNNLIDLLKKLWKQK